MARRIDRISYLEIIIITFNLSTRLFLSNRCEMSLTRCSRVSLRSDARMIYEIRHPMARGTVIPLYGSDVFIFPDSTTRLMDFPPAIRSI